MAQKTPISVARMTRSIDLSMNEGCRGQVSSLRVLFYAGAL